MVLELGGCWLDARMLDLLRKAIAWDHPSEAYMEHSIQHYYDNQLKM